MKRIGAAAVVLLIIAQLLALSNPDRRMVLWMGTAVAAVGLATVRWFLARDAIPAFDESRGHDPAESLQRWRSKTETLILRCDTNRSDWDRYLRPMLARQFELATDQRKSKDADDFHAAALALFGARLWPWVDPDNVSASGAAEAGPGRVVLNDILERLEGI